MKTEQQLENRISELMKEGELLVNMPKNKRAKAIKKRLTFLRFCLKYLETNTTEDCVKRQAKECERQIEIYDSRYLAWTTNTSDEIKEIKNIRQYYDKINGIPKLKEQLRMLGFLLSKSNP